MRYCLTAAFIIYMKEVKKCSCRGNWSVNWGEDNKGGNATVRERVNIENIESIESIDDIGNIDDAGNIEETFEAIEDTLPYGRVSALSQTVLDCRHKSDR
jgi:hypothetical protein